MQTLDNQLLLTSPIVNVSSVRHLSPFRYPGGKTWLVPKVISTLRNLPQRPAIFVDPFLGGGSVPLAALVEGYVDRLVLCEKDDNVAAVWQTVFSKEYEKLCANIMSFRCERDHILDLLSTKPQGTLSRAFQTIVRNRTFRGGIIANGASLVKAGENGRGVASRWYPDTLIKRIQELHKLREMILFIYGDGLKVLGEYSMREDVFIFVDPPYTAGAGKRAGSRLYDHSHVDHEFIFTTLEKGKAEFMMTYDDDIDVLNMSKRNGFFFQYVQMKNTHHQHMNELLITRT